MIQNGLAGNTLVGIIDSESTEDEPKLVQSPAIVFQKLFLYKIFILLLILLLILTLGIVGTLFVVSLDRKTCFINNIHNATNGNSTCAFYNISVLETSMQYNDYFLCDYNFKNMTNNTCYVLILSNKLYFNENYIMAGITVNYSFAIMFSIFISLLFIAEFFNILFLIKARKNEKKIEKK